MKYLSALALLAMLMLTGCETVPLRPKYDPIGYKPKNPANVVVKVSLSNRMVYVMEGSKPLLICATAIGKPDHPTPTGHFSVIHKIKDKRSGEYGFWINGSDIVAGTSSQSPGAGYKYKGFPMEYWVEFSPGYGFHVGSVWPTPRSHGCLRVHQNAGRELFELTKIGTPVYIAQTQPEDQTIGKNAPRPQDYNDPDPPKSYMVSEKVFIVDPTQTLRDQN